MNRQLRCERVGGRRACDSAVNSRSRTTLGNVRPVTSFRARARTWLVGRALAAGVALLGVVLVNPCIARAQTAPEGNAHPKTQAVTEYTGGNPFGDGSPTGMDIAAKKAFAEKLAASGGLDPLRDLAVF